MFKFLLKKKSKHKKIELKYVNRRTPVWKPLLLMLPALVIIVTFVVVPFIFTIRDSFLSYPDPLDASTTTVSTDNYKTLFNDKDFQKSITNSLTYAVFAVPLTLFVSIMIAGAISHIVRKRMRGVFQTIFFLPYVTSAIAISLTFAYLFDFDRGILNKIFGSDVPWLTQTDPGKKSALVPMITYGIWRGIAFQVLILTTAMLGVNKDLYKSSAIDGASAPRVFMSITLPSIKRTTNFLITMGIIGSLKVFPLALFDNDPNAGMKYGGQTLMLYIFAHLKSSEYFLVGAASVMLLIISIVFSIIMRQGLSLTLKLVGNLKERYVSNKINSQK